MMNNEIKLDEYTAPSGYIYHKDDRYISTVYLAPNASIGEYELITIEEYETRMEEELANNDHEAI